MSSAPYVSRGGEKLAAALDHFGVAVGGLVCADLGSHVGGFVDCLLRRGAIRVYSVDTSYGTLAWRLRRDPRVIVRERANAMHVNLPEAVDRVTIDVGWTRQRSILPNAARLVRPGGEVVTLIKPHYEAPAERLTGGVLPEKEAREVVEGVVAAMPAADWSLRGTMMSPIRGHGGNREWWALLRRT
ncbi:MAG: SAM-dependent methyltransferase [Phycisphaerae bacterium]